MGEWSRRIGEVGEEIVGEFLDLIGWGDSQRNLTLPCMKGLRHGNSGKSRTTHGIDYLFSYESQLSNRTLDHLVISVKYTLDPYPANSNSKFKEHFLDLAKTMECFKGSEIRQSSNSQFSGIDRARETGVLFWLSHDTSDTGDVIQKVSGARNLDDYNYGSIYVVDNKRVSFIYNTVKYLSSNRPDSDIEFFYPNTGKNYNPINKETSGKILPVEFVNSSVLPLKLSNKDDSKTFVVAVMDDFQKDNLKRLMGLSYEITSDFAKDTLILFPNFDRIRHENQVSEAKSSFRDKRFTENVRVSSYRADFRNTSNE
ncbi:hypothetical protein H6G45_04530 [Synechocystis sp. FACHB-383]|jgi:hypothetical protein|uniref:GapS4a family protein n=1 Tax=Synechocystis sp. FACHB-383 TaxID=2692864 RepID=UPI001683C244|nr:hypothetical protein [Synechocystis sp. FACHB-383]MBD2652774.1 hypothetical protein [Synechocystis sp. FACHB-383]